MSAFDNILTFAAGQTSLDVSAAVNGASSVLVFASTATEEKQLVEGVDYSIAGNTLSVLTDQSGFAITVVGFPEISLEVPAVGPVSGSAIESVVDAICARLNWVSYLADRAVRGSVGQPPTLSLANALDDLSAEVAVLEESVASAITRVDTAETAFNDGLSPLQSQITALSSAITATQNDATANTNGITNLAQSIGSVDTKADGIAANLASLSNQLSQTISAIQVSIAELEEAKTQTQMDAQVQGQTIANMQSVIQQQATLIDQLGDDIATLTDRVSAVEIDPPQPTVSYPFNLPQVGG